MYDGQIPYRQLYEDLLDANCRLGDEARLRAWSATHGRHEAQWLMDVVNRWGPETPAPDEGLCQLYALSRVVQLLALSFQTGDADGSQYRPVVSPEGFVRFAKELGLTVRHPRAFSRFTCEIVEVRSAADPSAPPRVTRVLWPALTFGGLLIQRAGVEVIAGARVLDARIASRSTLYWAHRRKSRPYHDPSHGWGSNSQWRTPFRRDYETREGTFFNVDGAICALKPGAPEGSPAFVDPDLSVAERIELLTFRCFVTSPTSHSDRYPYDDRLAVPRTERGTSR